MTAASMDRGAGGHGGLALSAVDSREAVLEELAGRCETELHGGVDELGLAAVLESWGITDATAVSRYGTTDVFALAAEMHTRLLDGEDVPLRRPQGTPWIRLSWILRAATYLPPTVFVVIALSASGHGASAAAFAAVTCLGCGMAEAASRVAYTTISFGGIEAMRDPNRRLLIWGSLVVAVPAVAVGVVAGSAFPALLVGAQLQYLLLSVVLLPMGRAQELVFWLTPAVVLGASVIAEPDRFTTVLVVAVICEMAATIHTWLMLGRIEPSPYGAPGTAELRTALPFLGSGILMGAFVLLCTAAVHTAVGSSRTLLVLVIPLMVSMGLAEIGIRWFQRAVAGELGRTAQVAQFARRARLLVLLSSGGYAVVLFSVDLLAVALTDPPPSAVHPAGYVLLGFVGLSLFLTLVLMVMDHVLVVLAAFGAGALAVGWLVLVLDPADGAVVPAAAVSAIVATYLFSVALRVVGHPANHAFT